MKHYDKRNGFNFHIENDPLYVSADIYNIP